MTQNTKHDWDALAQKLTYEGRAFINGQYVDSLSRETFDCNSPIDGRLLVKVASAGEADVEAAVRSARSAFDSGVWANLPPRARKKIMIRFSDLVEINQDELALLETLDSGKAIVDSIGYDLPATIDCIRWTAEAIDKLYDEVAPTAANHLGLVIREAVGVVAAIVPWNFPILMASWKFAPALAAGNSVILKPSEKSPLTAIRIAQLALEAGIPPGVFNVLPGFGHTVGKAIGLHPDIDTLAFTGSTKVGKQLLHYAGDSNMKQIWIEAGGKSPNIVFADTPNLKLAVQHAVMAFVYNQGQVCNAGTRLLIEKPIKDEFLNMMIEELQQWKIGNPLDPNVRIGSLIDDQQLSVVQAHIDRAIASGATLLTGGTRLTDSKCGFFIIPTIFTDVDNSMPIAREEIFGPVLAVIEFETEDQALAIANDSIYGLGAAVWSESISRIHRFTRGLRAGCVWVNHYGGGDMTSPFGGYKQSGNGRDRSLHAIEKYTELKSILIKHESLD